VGIDLVSIDEVADAIRVHGNRYLERIFTAAELRDCEGKVSRLAARFAAKEAAIKALCPGDEDVLPWTDLEVVRNPQGWVDLVLYGQAAAHAEGERLGEFAVSLTRAGAHAAAIVVAKTRV
jgi:holo-[acyl-carrier protein] synthase